MPIQQQQRDNLYKALGLFIEAFRLYAVSVLQKEAGSKWVEWFAESLAPHQKDGWERGIKAGTLPETLIDYQYLKGFVLKYRDLLKADFGKDMNKLATWMESINEVRNKFAHFDDISDDEFTATFIHTKSIARSLKMEDLVTELEKLQTPKDSETVDIKNKSSSPNSPLMPWFRAVTPHSDIKQGNLDESVFAANLAEVALGSGRAVYSNAVLFFSKTYFTDGLKSVAKTVIKGLNGAEDAENRVISLQTGFGGGKTHTLISLYHICKQGRNFAASEYVRDLIAYTGKPHFEKAQVAVFTNTTNDPANGRITSTGIRIQTIWGEIAYQLGGAEAYEIVRKNDEQLIAPGGLFKKILEQCQPALILVDELADYCVKASARKAGNSSLADQTISFMQELTEAVAGVNNCVAVITLPASPQEVGNTQEAQSILNSLQKRVSRVGADTQPVADDEIYEVIRRRLFEDIGEEGTRETVISEYIKLYEEHKTELPQHVTKSEYKERMLKSYPFHPELIDVFRIRWASHHDFQRTRGMLRLLAALVSDLWKRQQSLPGGNLLIDAGQINFANLDAMSGQLKRLYGNGYDAVISADVAGSASNAFKIDSNKKEYGDWYLTQHIAAIVLMNSFGSDGANKGVSIPEIKLHLLVPQGFNHNSINGALGEMEGVAYYMYYSQIGSSGKRYWYHTKPNINILINQAKADIKTANIEAEIVRRIKEETNNNIQFFKVITDPSDEIPEQQKPTLVILNPRYIGSISDIGNTAKELIKRIATKKGNTDRIYRNTFLFLMCSEIGSAKLQSDVRDYLSCQKIDMEYRSQLETEQKLEIRKKMEEASKQTDNSIAVAYSMLVKYSVKKDITILPIKEFKDRLGRQINTTIPELLKEEEWLLSSVGLNTLRNNQLLPAPSAPVRTKDIYEAFIRFDDKPMITDISAVNDSLKRYCADGHFCIASGDGSHFTKYYLSENVPAFEANDMSYWLVDKTDKPQPILPIEKNYIPTKGTEELDVAEEEKLSLKTELLEQFRTLIVSGKVPLERYTELFNYFVAPFAMQGYKLDISIEFKISSAEDNPFHPNHPQYKNAVEAAKQLKLSVEKG